MTDTKENSMEQDTIEFLGKRLLKDVRRYIFSKWTTERIGRDYHDALCIVNTVLLDQFKPKEK
jgi:hypothetical protein